MPFHKYSPKTAKTLFKSAQSPSSAIQQSPSQNARTQSNERKTTSVAEALKEKFEHTRALIASVQKERYNSDLEQSRLGLKEAARARIEAAQRAALDDELRNDALEELRKQELPAVIQKLEEEMKPKVQEDLLVRLRADLQPKVHAELRTELIEEVSEKLWTELRLQLRDDVTEQLRIELHETLAESVRDQLYHELYPKVVADLKDEYRDMVLLQLKDELATDTATQLPGVNGHPNDLLDPALLAESETSDIGHPPSQLAVIAKRRFSEGFGSDDPDTRAKKIKTVNQDAETLVAAESLPLFGSFASQRDVSVKHVDESLDEGEKADIEDGSESHKLVQEASESLEEKAEKVNEMAIPEDIHAEGDDELSQSDDEKRELQEQSDQDADAEMETEADRAAIINELNAKQESQDAQSIHKSTSNSIHSAEDGLPEAELDQEPEPIHFLRKYKVKAEKQKPITSKKDSSPMGILSKSKSQVDENDVPQSNHNNSNQIEEENGEEKPQSPSNETEDEDEDEDEDEEIDEEEGEEDADDSDSNTSSPNPWSHIIDDKRYKSSDTEIKPTLGSSDSQWMWGHDGSDYGSQDNGEESEEEEGEGEDEGYPYAHPHPDEEDNEAENSEEEDGGSDENLETIPPHPIYSQGGHQDDPISLDSD